MSTLNVRGFMLSITGDDRGTAGARFSPCGTYRYRLWREWADGGACCFVMLNPSTADEIANDPTVERCQRRARAWGYGRLDVVNLFALRSTDPRALYPSDERPAGDVIGPENDAAIIEATSEARIVICGWGEHGRLDNRGLRVRRMLNRRGIRLHALKLNASGEPAHPLYLPYSIKPVPMP